MLPFTPKTYKQRMEPFKSRLLERYGIMMTDIEYDKICSLKGLEKHII